MLTICNKQAASPQLQQMGVRYLSNLIGVRYRSNIDVAAHSTAAVCTSAKSATQCMGQHCTTVQTRAAMHYLAAARNNPDLNLVTPARVLLNLLQFFGDKSSRRDAQ